MDKPGPLRRPSRRLVYAFLALLPLAGCGSSPASGPNPDKTGGDNVGTAPGGNPP